MPQPGSANAAVQNALHARAAQPAASAEQRALASKASERHRLLSAVVRFDMQTVLGLRPGTDTKQDCVREFGEPTATASLPEPTPEGCTELWTWARPPEALSVAFDPNGAVCSVATAGGPSLN
jgi:hypothetical protein